MASRRSDGTMRKPSMAPEIKRQLSTRMSVQIQPVPVATPGQSEAMRVGRKAMPYVAICVFFLTFVVFMWVLPCNWGGCPSMCSQTRIKAWQEVLSGLELKGNVLSVPGLGTRSRNLVFLVRCRVFLEELEPEEGARPSYCSPDVEGGLLALAGSTGDVAWWRPLHGLPRDINCSLVDVNENGVFDCIVVGDKGLLEAIDPVTGAVRWHVHYNKTLQRPVDLEFPVILPDLDGDSVSDLLASCRITDESRFPSVTSEHNYLALVSGKTGRILGRLYRVPVCSRIRDLQLQNLQNHLRISYICQDETDEESYETISLQVLYALITNHAIVNANTSVVEYQQHVPMSVVGGQPIETEDGRRLTLEHSGRCPLCDVTVRITDPENYILWNFTSRNTHAMRPVALSVNNVSTSTNDTSAPGTVSGFILKLWLWVNIGDEGRVDTSTPLKSLGTSKERFLRANQNRTPARTGRPNVYTSVNQLQERTVLVTFRETGVDIRTVSEHNITQLCSHVDEDMICQPDLTFQEQSLLIADLGLDGDQELVTFFSTYHSSGPDAIFGPWLFRSEVHVIPLEAVMLTGPAL